MRVRFTRVLILATLAAVSACTTRSTQPDLDGKDVRVTFIHTTDIHSRLIPYNMQVILTDRNLGLQAELGPFGGAARIAHIARRERARAERSLHIDTGDSFQGAPIFNVFQGEVEMQVLSEIGVDCMAIGNHEFDSGEANVADKIARFARFPVMAANYYLAPNQSALLPPLYGLVSPYEIFNVEGLRVGVIGLGNTSSMTGLVEYGNPLGITALDFAEVTQFYIDQLKPQVDVIVVASHLGLSDDKELIERTTGIDLVLGGHHHVVLNPPQVIHDCQPDKMPPAWKEKFLRTHADCKPREVPLAHSGAFAKYVGIMDVVFRQLPDDPAEWEVASFKYRPIPVDSTVPEDPRVAEMMERYTVILKQKVPLDTILGYAPGELSRYGSQGGDSPIGNMVAEAMRRRKGVETDFALTNTLGIRSDISAGPITVDLMYNVFPFENSISTMYLSGREVIELFDYVARRSSNRGCQAQAQIAGVRATLMCGRCDPTMRAAGGLPPVEGDVDACSAYIGFAPVVRCDGVAADPQAVYEDCDPPWGGAAPGRCCIQSTPVELDAQYQLAANDYIAKGGSGFMVLKRNTTQVNTYIPQRDALMDSMRAGEACGRRNACQIDADCDQGYVCGCSERSQWSDAGTCDRPLECPADGICVLEKCITDVSAIFGKECATLAGAELEQCSCDQGGRAILQCATTACIDKQHGIREDGRLRLVMP